MTTSAAMLCRVGWCRRGVLGVLAAGSVALVGGSAPRGPSSSWPVSSSGGYMERLRKVVARFLVPTEEHPGHPSYPGAALFAAVGGRVAAHFAVGDAVRYDADKALLPEGKRVAATPDTMYDLASLTKVFTAVLVLRLVERGRLDLDAPVARYLPEFAGKAAVTVRMLLAHTSGLSPDVPIRGAGRDERLAHLLREPVQAAPGSRYCYADKNFIALGALVERLGEQRLDAQVGEQIAGPLGMRDTMFRPPRGRWGRVAATEGARRGVVHDQAAFALDGVAGHAGLFATAYDVGMLGRALLDGGGCLLRPMTVASMLTNENARLGPGAAHGLGVDLDQPWYMGRLASAPTFGHTGFTGTSLVVDPLRRVVLVLLTNRVHPDPGWGGINAARRVAADVLAG